MEKLYFMNFLEVVYNIDNKVTPFDFFYGEC